MGKVKRPAKARNGWERRLPVSLHIRVRWKTKAMWVRVKAMAKTLHPERDVERVLAELLRRAERNLSRRLRSRGLEVPPVVEVETLMNPTPTLPAPVQTFRRGAGPVMMTYRGQ